MKKQQTTMDQFTKNTMTVEEIAFTGTFVKFSQKKVRELITVYLILDELSFIQVD